MDTILHIPSAHTRRPARAQHRAFVLSATLRETKSFAWDLCEIQSFVRECPGSFSLINDASDPVEEQGIRIIIFLEWTTLFFLSIKDENFTRISRITRKHTLLSLVCCRPEGKREWNDAFFAWFARFAWAKNSVRWECFYNAFSLVEEVHSIYRCPSVTLLITISYLVDRHQQRCRCPSANNFAGYLQEKCPSRRIYQSDAHRYKHLLMRSKQLPHLIYNISASLSALTSWWLACSAECTRLCQCQPIYELL